MFSPLMIAFHKIYVKHKIGTYARWDCHMLLKLYWTSIFFFLFFMFTYVCL